MNGGRDGELIRRVEKLEKSNRELVAIKNMGRGALWMLFKIGILAATLIGIAMAAWRAIWGGA